MPKLSAGILLFRSRPTGVEVMLVHPGGPFWARRTWAHGRSPRASSMRAKTSSRRRSASFSKRPACRSRANFSTLAPTSNRAARRSSPGRVEGDFDPASLKSNTFAIEWPPRSGRMAEFPEVDRAAWYSIDEATQKINKGQSPIIAALRSLDGSIRWPIEPRNERPIAACYPRRDP